MNEFEMIGYTDRKSLNEKAMKVRFDCIKDFQKKCKGVRSLRDKMNTNLEDMLIKEEKFLLYEADSKKHIQEIKKVKKKEEDNKLQINNSNKMHNGKEELEEITNDNSRSVKRQGCSSTISQPESKRIEIEDRLNSSHHINRCEVPFLRWPLIPCCEVF